MCKLLGNENCPEARLEAAFEAEPDEHWPYEGSKANQRWLWYAVDHATTTVLAYVFGKRKDGVFKQLKALLEPFGMTRYYPDDSGAYERHLGAASTKSATAIPRK